MKNEEINDSSQVAEGGGGGRYEMKDRGQTFQVDKNICREYLVEKRERV